MGITNKSQMYIPTESLIPPPSHIADQRRQTSYYPGCQWTVKQMTLNYGRCINSNYQSQLQQVMGITNKSQMYIPTESLIPPPSHIADQRRQTSYYPGCQWTVKQMTLNYGTDTVQGLWATWRTHQYESNWFTLHQYLSYVKLGDRNNSTATKPTNCN